ncbi:amidohydrolase family protein [Conexibacter stalactiti]|uniref:Amidohydrolase family protein n=1 Tax=Conexibacter stalactiti TaxID=1940611 RepID=A0ABU4HY60_9ACTN|nr:amidohydrolase family protein [Conexibacter stalactiti]MDW5597410.1 amidohydrolase family protein [Conexibacter stalactiti]MEC5038052.1 amidohydrolase family protein [Conexibacter stalactiti]
MSVEEFDLVVRGGTVVTAASRAACDVGVAGGRIVQVGGPMRGRRELDASGAYVLPGALDMHVHLSASAPTRDDPPRFVDDFLTGSRAALAGGVTTLGQMSFPDDETSIRAVIARDMQAAGEQALVDYAFHAGVFTATDDLLEAIPELAAQGHMGLKLVMLAFDHDPRDLIAAAKLAGDLGMLTMIHCEDNALIEFAGAQLLAEGRGGMEHYPLSRPDWTETAAVERAAAICAATGAPINVVHLSSGAALEATRRARARGLPLFVEARPLYLTLDASVHAQPDSGRFAGMPPVRQPADVEALWRGLADGSIQTVGSDHAPWFLRDKTWPGIDVTTARKGMAELETMIPLLHSEGVARGRLTLERLVAVTATNPALLHGLYPRKGTIAPGADADLVIFDPELTRTVDAAAMQSRADYCVYDGWEVRGWPRTTISRGEVLYDDGSFSGEPGRGEWIARGKTVAP